MWILCCFVMTISSMLLLGFFGLLVLGLLIAVLLRMLQASGGRNRSNNYGVESITQNGELVRSIGEKTIADYFQRNNIRYIYEKAVFSHNFSRSRILHPDFYLPDYDVYVEYWGLVDADDEWTKNRYVKNMKRKMAIYYSNGINFVSLYPHNLANLDYVFRVKFKKVTGIDLSN